VDNKDRNGVLKNEFLKQIAAIFHVDTFIETGTYTGVTTARAATIFKTVHTVELHPKLYEKAKTFLQKYKNVTVHNGNSAAILKRILPTIDGNLVLWLDAHYCGENTAMSFDDPNDGNAITAIRSELDGLYESGITDCVVLIDDIRGFGTTIDDTKYTGCWAYPSIQEVCTSLLQVNKNFEFALLGDTLLAYDKTKYTVPLSSVVQACTQSRLYDGKNLTDEELLNTESAIAKAKGDEYAFIQELYKRMTDYGDPMFLHDLWYGLICLGSEQFKEAHIGFSKVLNRKERFDQNRNIIDKNIGYRHPRIDGYLNQCTALEKS
jgi:hypothetical protein